MTQIRGFIPPTRRPNALGVHSLDYFSLAVPDLGEAQRFYQNFGLDVRERGEALHLGTDGFDHSWGILSEGPRKQLQHLSFGAFADDMDRFRARLDQLGIERLDPPPDFESNGLWFHDCDGILIEIKVAGKTSPNAKSEVSNPSSPPGVQGAFMRGQAPMVRPRRLAHILIFTRDIPRTIRFYQNVLGLRLSDEAGGVVAFMHGIHGSDHHLIALAKSDAPGFHHASWDVGSIQDVGLGAMQMADKGFSAGWGLGAPCAGIQLLPLCPRSLGQLRRVLVGYRLRAGGDGLAGGSSCPREQPVSLGTGAAEGLRHQLRIPGHGTAGKGGGHNPPGGPVATPAHRRKNKDLKIKNQIACRMERWGRPPRRQRTRLASLATGHARKGETSHE